MNDALTQEIRESIAKNLPQAVGDELKQRLIQADIDAKAAKERLEKIDSLRAIESGLRERIDRLEAQLEQAGDLAKREAEVAKRGRDAENAALRTQLQAAHLNAQFARDVALGLVRNTEFRKTLSENGSVPMPSSQPGGYSTPMTMPTNNSTVSTETQA